MGFALWLSSFGVILGIVLLMLVLSVMTGMQELLKKKDPNRPHSKWIGYMHGINRISIFLFLLALIILAVKLLRH